MIRAKDFFRNRQILAFTHLPKAAGTTFQYLLRANFFGRYCEGLSLSRNPHFIFEKEDMIKTLTVNPLIKCIASHIVLPYGSLIQSFTNIRFIILLRNPIERYISHYLFRVEKMGDKFNGIEEFLNTEWTFNLQTKRIAGSNDLKRAKDILERRFFLVGTVEEFDGFLILLKKKLEPMNFQIYYSPKNVGKKDSILKKKILNNLSKWIVQIKDRNRLDLELYKYVKNEILPRQKEEYGSNYERDLEDFRKCPRKESLALLKYLDYILRKFYYAPMFKLMRKIS